MIITDLVPAEVRRSWAADGRYADLGLFEHFERRVRATPHAVAVIDELGGMTFQDLHETALRVAGGLRAAGVGLQDVVMVQLPNGRHACAVDLAVLALGAITLPVNLSRGGREAAQLLATSEARCAVSVGVYRGYEYLRQLLDDRAGEAGPTLTSLQDGLGVPSWSELVRHEPIRPVRPCPDSAARIMVSSGTEAIPKLVAFSHNALATGLSAVIAEILEDGEVPRVLWLVPMSSAFGSNALIGTLIMHGGTLVLQNHFDAARARDLMHRQQPSHIFCVPTMLRRLLDDIDRHPAPARRSDGLRTVVTGGAPLEMVTQRRAVRMLGVPVVNSYGSSDGVHCQVSEDSDGRARVGSPNPRVVDIRIVDDDLRDVPAGTVGEILARGPFTPLCYVGAAHLNARYRTSDGWVRTDDLGILDGDGRLSVVGRRKEIVVRGGANISPAEVEELIALLPGVREVACVGVPDELMGERLCACVVLRPGAQLGLAEMVTHLRSLRLEDRKLPEHLLVLEELPYNENGKVDRVALRARSAGLPQLAPR